MRKRWAFLTVSVALVLGMATPLLLTRHISVPLRVATSCMLLNEAGKAGYLSQEARSALIEKAATAPSLAAADRQLVAGLRSECGKLGIKL